MRVLQAGSENATDNYWHHVVFEKLDLKLIRFITVVECPNSTMFFADDWIKEVCEMYKKETETKMKIHNALLEQIREPAKTEISQQSDTLEVWLP